MCATLSPKTAIVLVASALLATASHAATYSADVTAASGTRNISGPTNTDTFTGGVPSGGLSESSSTTENANIGSSFSNGASVSMATARSLSGALQLSGSGNANLTTIVSSPPMSASASGTSNARFTDSFVVTCASAILCANGQTGQMTVAFLVQGDFGGGGTITPNGILSNGGWNGYAQWAAGLNIVAAHYQTGGVVGAANWAGGQTRSESQLGGSTVGYNVSYPYAEFGVQLLTFDFEFGGPVAIDMLGKVSAYAAVGYDSSGSTAQSAFQSSLTTVWGGVQNITGAGGAQLAGVQGLSLSSAATGIDYLQSQVSAVPEPGMALMLATGSLLLIPAVRSQRRRRV